ncbi:MAG: V-type ATP synthase subunit A [Caldiserica bacterium]|nr:MAG: V-type ATP synthase subunit A [Caldisericota bacterium]
MEKGVIVRVTGPLVVARDLKDVKMHEVVRVGDIGLIGEVVEIRGEDVYIQVYEETSGIGPGERVIRTGEPLSVELGPGLLSTIYDGIQRPLERIRDEFGSYIVRGVNIPGLDRNKKWRFTPICKKGEVVSEGDIIGEVEETGAIKHKIMIPPGIGGKIVEINEGEFTVLDTVAKVEKDGKVFDIRMMQRWPVRKQRPIKKKLKTDEPLITGTRVIDTFFTITKGGTAAIPGPFGSGKTVILHQLAKWSDADIIVYIGCGERGNEMTDVLTEFPELKDPRTGRSLMERTVLIANTSNMPVAAREASIYTGITIAEYFRDMGYKVALMADSTSRWAEALREMSGRMEEMPGEEGYPAYLGTRIAEFYERAGKVVCLGSDGRIGALSAIGAVSPPGGDLSDPVVQNTLRVVKVFWSLEDKLAYQRHFPAISWLRSYSLYIDNIRKWAEENLGSDFILLRAKALEILQKEDSLIEVVRLVGMEALSEEDKLILDTAKMIREDFLSQHAFDPEDTYTFIDKQYLMLKIIITFHHKLKKLISSGKGLDEYKDIPIREKIARMKYVKHEDFKGIFEKIIEEIERLK